MQYEKPLVEIISLSNMEVITASKEWEPDVDLEELF